MSEPETEWGLLLTQDRGIATEDLFPFASQVDSGIAELTRKQEAGWDTSN